MESFSDLLNQYVQRLGISDTELGRALGLSRQTIFRWREGLTERPRRREDVLALAQKLRLAPQERDRLLLAAGFRPEEPETPDLEVTRRPEPEEAAALALEVPATTGSSPPAPRRFGGQRPAAWRAVIIAGLILLAGAGLLWLTDRSADSSAKTTPGAAAGSGILPSNVTGATASLVPANQPASPSETVILVAHFANYAGSQIGYNVAGRLAEALQREVDAIGQPDVRIAIWPNPVAERDLALQAGREMSATLVIYGEYDAGRVVVAFAQPGDQSVFTNPALQQHVLSLPELSATINSDLPQQIRSLALMALGQIYLNQRQAEQARPLLVQARHNLQNDPTVDAKTWALANFYLGIAYHHSQPPNLDEAIKAYSQAIAAWPQMISSRLNRIAAYEKRRQAGDLQQALADANTVIAAAPEWAVAYNNRASIRMNLGGGENLALALADLNQALALDPTLPEAYFNRAQLYFEQGHPMAEIAPDLTRALALRPAYGNALNLLCWGYALEQQPEVALPYCQQAVEADPRPLFLDSRGLAYALLGDYPAAISDFQVYVAWLEEQPGDDRQSTTLERYRAWIDRLENGQNPFTPEVLSQLRSEFGQQR